MSLKKLDFTTQFLSHIVGRVDFGSQPNANAEPIDSSTFSNPELERMIVEEDTNNQDQD